MRSCRAVLSAVIVLAAGACAQDEPRLRTAREIVARWRDAAESRREPMPHTARFKSVARADGGKIKITEWVTSTGDYRRVAKRRHGKLEVVLLSDTGTLRDWDGSVRTLAGPELECWRALAFETRTLAFGPSGVLATATVAVSEDKRAYLLRATPPQAAPMTWYVDAQTFLPQRAVLTGCDLQGTTDYSDWREKNLVFTAFHAWVRETGRAEYEMERKDVRIDNSAQRFHPLAPR